MKVGSGQFTLCLVPTIFFFFKKILFHDAGLSESFKVDG